MSVRKIGILEKRRDMEPFWLDFQQTSGFFEQRIDHKEYAPSAAGLFFWEFLPTKTSIFCNKTWRYTV
jgi:hypothetical protein